LSIARAIAEGHDGQLILEANEPTGLIVSLQLPARSAPGV
jgi:signal transduction histidine kinase